MNRARLPFLFCPWWCFLGPFSLAAGCGAEGPGPAPAGTLLVVATPALREAAAAYGAFRQQAGFRVEFSVNTDLAPAGTPLSDRVAARVREFADAIDPRAPGFVLIIGDADETAPEDPAFIPVRRVSGGVVNYTWTQVGDGPYADLDGDLVPDLAIGRLPFRNAGQLEAYRERLRAHEASYRPGPWNKTLATFAGEGGFGPEIDGMLEMVAGWVFDEMSYDFDLSMTYASPSSAFHLPYGAWEDHYRKTAQAGALAIPYVGHTLGAIDCCEGEPPARRGLNAFFSCSDGSFQVNWAENPYLSLAEELLLRSQGPIATLAATDVSHPYGNAILPRELGHALLDLRPATYGQAVLQMKRGAVYRLDELRTTIDQAAGLYTSEPLDQLVLEHVVMYNLLGDPTAPTHISPASVTLDPPPAPPPSGGSLEVAGAAPDVGQGTVEVTFELTRTRLKEGIADCSAGCSAEQYASNHGLANDKVLARASGAVQAGRFQVTLELPALSTGTYHLKAFAENDTLDAVGSRAVDVP